MNNAVIQFSFTGLSANYCFTGFDRFALDIVAGMQGYLPGTYSTIVRSATEPVAADRDKVWFQVNADGAATGKQFTYAYGKWVMLNPRVASGDERVWWTGSESDAWSYDGGDGTDPSSNPPTATSGAMWVRDRDYDFRFPLAAGTSAKPTTVSPGDTGGNEEIVQTAAQVAKHQHLVWPADGGDGNTGKIWSHLDPGGESCASALEKIIQPNDNCDAQTTLVAQFQADGDESMNVMPPWRCGMWLKRSARAYFTP